MKEEAKYIWKYKNNMYKKLAACLLLACLAYFQETYIGSFSILLLALLTLTLQC
jgi:hypothetical protein